MLGRRELTQLADELAPLVHKIYTETGREREIAIAQWIQSFTNLPQDYRPAPIPKLGRELRHLACSQRLDKDISELDAPSCRSLSEHREKVTYGETVNARKLLVLGTALKRLAEIPGGSHGLEEFIGRFLYEEWGITSVPLQGDLRVWAERASRDYEALPRTLREISFPEGKAVPSDNVSQKVAR